MSRAERLLSLLELLQTREETTAHELAQALETSVRGVRRDLAALRGRGVELLSASGRGGARDSFVVRL